MNSLALSGQARTHLIEHPQLGWVHADIVEDLLRLQAAAKREGISLAILSGFRSFDAQQAIWNGKWQGLRPLLDDKSQVIDASCLSESEKLHAILRWSALPGASRHHWGTDFDVYAPELLAPNQRLALIPEEYNAGGCQAPLRQWLEQHALSYGFFFPYARDQGGIGCEPWHLSHLAQSQSMLAHFTLDMLHSLIAQSDLQGKQQILHELDTIYARYICNICLPDCP